jgi:glycosyltransferase involved in cell wall biosynthesis
MRKESGPPNPHRTRVFQVVTKLELGGAQKVVLATLERLPSDRYDRGLVAGPEGLLRDVAERLSGVACHWIPTLVREVSPWRDLRALVDLWRLFRRERPDIVHTHSSKAGILGRWAAWLAGVPVIVHTAHGFGFNDYQRPWVRRLFICLERACRPITTRTVMVSRDNATRAESLGIVGPGEWILSRPGIDTGAFQQERPRRASLEAWGIPPGRTVVGMVACFKPQKAPVDFVDVAARVLEHERDVHFVMAGDGEMRGAIEARIAAHGIGEHFTLLGWVDDMPEVYRNLDVVVLTSLWEGQPCVFAEAMASGLPIVATAADGAREAIVDGENGYVHERRDVDRLARSVSRLVQEPELRRRMGEAGRARAPEFDIARTVREIEAEYRRIRANGESGVIPAATVPKGTHS